MLNSTGQTDQMRTLTSVNTEMLQLSNSPLGQMSGLRTPKGSTLGRNTWHLQMGLPLLRASSSSPSSPQSPLHRGRGQRGEGVWQMAKLELDSKSLSVLKE